MPDLEEMIELEAVPELDESGEPQDWSQGPAEIGQWQASLLQLAIVGGWSMDIMLDMVETLVGTVQGWQQLLQAARELPSAIARIMEELEAGLNGLARGQQSMASPPEAAPTEELELAGIDAKAARKSYEDQPRDRGDEVKEQVAEGIYNRLSSTDRHVEAVDRNTIALDRLSDKVGGTLPLTQGTSPGSPPPTSSDLLGGSQIPEVLGQALWMLPAVTEVLNRSREAVAAASNIAMNSPAPTGSPSSTRETNRQPGDVVDVHTMNKAVTNFEVALGRLEVALDKATQIHVTVSPGDEWD